MTPKEMAKELVDKFIYIKELEDNGGMYYSLAKQCALIAVDEILSIDNIKPYILHKEIIEFYQEVKQQIELL